MTEPTYRHSATSAAVLHALVPVICPAEAVPLADAIVAHVAATLGASPRGLQLGFAAGLATYDLGALPSYRRRARALRGDAAEAYFTSWEHGPTPLQVQLARGINQLVSLACYEQPEMTEALGYRPAPWIAEVSRRRLATYAGDVARQAAQILAPDPLRAGERPADAARRDARGGQSPGSAGVEGSAKLPARGQA
jgi:hypothetical protein